MAVSGRKQTDMIGSIAAGSTEDFDHKCEPCLTIGRYVEAHGFCVECQEYLCKTCFDCHRRTKLSRNHQILGHDEFDEIQTTRTSYNKCTEECPLHQKEIIKFYCRIHSSLGCNDCMIIDHRTCKIDYIPEKCADIADSKEYEDIIMNLSQKLKEAEQISKNAESSRNDINDINMEVIKKIEEFRAEINLRLDQLQKDILNKVERRNLKNKKIVLRVIDTSGNIISDLKKLQCGLRTNKSDNQNGQLYIDIKRTESALKSYEFQEEEEKLMNMNIKFSFHRSADLDNLLSKKIIFGELIENLDLKVKNDINVKTKSDKEECYITGCAFLSKNELVLADYQNKKVKVVSIENKLVLQEKTLESQPWDTAVMCQNQFSITMPKVRKVDVMTKDDKLSRVCSIKVDGECYGIDFHQDHLYVVCTCPTSVVVLTLQGIVLRNSRLNFPLSSYISMSPLERILLFCISVTLATIVIYKKIANPRSICYNAPNDEVYVGCVGDKLKVFGTK